MVHGWLPPLLSPIMATGAGGRAALPPCRQCSDRAAAPAKPGLREPESRAGTAAGNYVTVTGDHSRRHWDDESDPVNGPRTAAAAQAAGPAQSGPPTGTEAAAHGSDGARAAAAAGAAAGAPVAAEPRRRPSKHRATVTDGRGGSFTVPARWRAA